MTIFTQGAGTVGPSTPTVEPEDFLPLAWIVLIVGLGVAGVRATWRSRPLWVLAVGLALAVVAFLSAWTILGFLYAPSALLLLLAALALALSGNESTDRVKSHAQLILICAQAKLAWKNDRLVATLAVLAWHPIE